MKSKGKVYKKMLITYLLVLFIPVLCSAVFYEYTYNTVREQSIYYNRNLLETIKSSCDREMLYFKSVLQQLRVDDLVMLLVSDNSLSEPEKQWNAYSVQQVMNDIVGSMREDAGYCKDLFLYQKDNGEMLSNSSKVDFDSYSKIIVKMDEETAGKVKDILDKVDRRKSYLINTNNEEYLLMVEPLWDSDGRRANAVVGVWIKTEIFERCIQSMEWNQGIEWALIDENGNYLYMTDELKESVQDFSGLELENGKTISIGEQKYLTYKLTSRACDGEYILFSSMEFIERTVNGIRNVYLLCLIAIVFLGIWATRTSVKINYAPLKSLLNTISQKSDDKNVENEYQYLEKQVNDLVQKYSSTQESVKKNREAVRNLVLEKLLLPSGEKVADTPLVREIHAKFQNGMNGVLLFAVRDGESEESVIPESELRRYIVANVLAEGIGEVYTQETFEYGDKVAMIVNIPEGTEGYEEQLQRLCNKLCEFVEENFKFKVCTFVGNFYKEIKGIHDSYLEACLIERFCEYMDEAYICYNEIEDYGSRKYQYSFEIEETVINAVRNCNAELACSLIDTVLEKSFQSKETSLRQCMLYDIFTTLIKVSEEMGVSLKKLPLINQVLSQKSSEEVQKWFHNIVKDICEKGQAISNNGKGNGLLEEIMTYITANYTNPDLNISQIAFEFQMTPTYLSAVFKKQTGKSILDVIKQMRLDYAKELIAQDLSVAEVAEKAGFRESSTFIRAFKTSTGVTPGQMKKLK